MKSLGKKKAAQLAATHPGITLPSWLDQNYKHVTLSTSITEGATRLVCPQSNVELTIALLSTENVADWARVALHSVTCRFSNAGIPTAGPRRTRECISRLPRQTMM